MCNVELHKDHTYQTSAKTGLIVQVIKLLLGQKEWLGVCGRTMRHNTYHLIRVRLFVQINNFG